MGIVKRLRTRFDRCKRGYNPNPRDARDFQFRASESEIRRLPKSVHLLNYLPLDDDWLYQGSKGTCVAHAIANQVYAAEFIKSGARPSSNISRRYLYYYARYLEDFKQPTGDNGCYPRLAYKSINKLGLPPEKYWRYKTGKLNRSPSYKVRKASLNDRRNLQYDFLHKDLNDIRVALSQKKIVTFGTQVTQDMINYRSGRNEILKDPRGSSLLGGHLMAIFGYANEHFFVANSWHGREILLMHESWFTWKHTRDLCIIHI